MPPWPCAPPALYAQRRVRLAQGPSRKIQSPRPVPRCAPGSDWITAAAHGLSHTPGFLLPPLMHHLERSLIFYTLQNEAKFISFSTTSLATALHCAERRH
jgi:hypothetical protein